MGTCSLLVLDGSRVTVQESEAEVFRSLPKESEDIKISCAGLSSQLLALTFSYSSSKKASTPV